MVLERRYGHRQLRGVNDDDDDNDEDEDALGLHCTLYSSAQRT